MLKGMIHLYEKNTQKKVETVITDSKYGTTDNFVTCHDSGIKAHIPSLEQTNRGSGRRKGIFSKETFSYDPNTDTFLCPAGQVLKKTSFYRNRNHFEYRASLGICSTCHLRDQCTRSKTG